MAPSATILALPQDVVKANADGQVKLFGKWETSECVHQYHSVEEKQGNKRDVVWDL